MTDKTISMEAQGKTFSAVILALTRYQEVMAMIFSAEVMAQIFSAVAQATIFYTATLTMTNSLEVTETMN